jgi:predicted amidohydrolase
MGLWCYKTCIMVFLTDFGRVGCAICFDLNFRDVIQGLGANGAEIVFFPSMY